MKSKKGISLIVLIITIIVVIILAAAVILSMNNNNPISSAKEAVFENDKASMQDELSMYLSKKYADNPNSFDVKSETFSGDTMVKNLPSTKKYVDKVKVVEGKLVWSDGVLAKDVNASYYGKTVSNYGDSYNITWKVFYADASNIYLISSDYIDLTLLPVKNGSKPANIDSNYPKAAELNDILSGYDGSSDITDVKLVGLNSSYFSYLKDNNSTSTNKNMKAVAYMMDTEIWGKFKDSNNRAEYVIGGPTIEMLFNSYNTKYSLEDKYQVKVSDASGYQMSTSSYYELNTENSFYAISKYDEAKAYWVASPSYGDGFGLISVSDEGNVYFSSYWSTWIGFRPVVCLNSEIHLKLLDNGNVELN